MHYFRLLRDDNEVAEWFVLLLMKYYFSGGRTIIFTETKDYASELAGSLPGARPLHGDIQQAQREVKVLSRMALFAEYFVFVCVCESAMHYL